MESADGKVIIVGVTGASGAVLAQTAIRLLAADDRVARIHLVITDAGLRLLDHELGITGPLAGLPAQLMGPNAGRSTRKPEGNTSRGTMSGDSVSGGSEIRDTAGAAVAAAKIEPLPNSDIGASIASGSYPADAMCIIPCSMGMLSAIAAGASTDLVSRAADVSLKEGRRLALCIRDTPFSRIHIENMLRAQQAGAVIMPAIPSFYHHPQTIDDLVTQYVCRVLSQLGLPQNRQFAWKGQNAENSKAKSKSRNA
jgi:4-hydroxy-3-polyprenylbenzoate decarboxylase